MSKPPYRKPTRNELLAAENRTVPDVIAPGLKVLFCGINPGLYSGVTGFHFARPGNRFWPTLHAAGFTDRLLGPWEEWELVERGYGITNVVERATAGAADLSERELAEGGQKLRAKVEHYRPQWLAVLGISAYRTAFGQPKAVLGPQSARIGETRLWVLPNPSGLNAHYQAQDLARLFQELRLAVEGRVA
jgi:double-stranded uracil-DNA glycosylase